MKPRIAASSYLNSAPLIWSFTKGTRTNDVEWIDAVPSRCAQLLANNEVDAALVPVIEYQRIPNLQIVPHVCVGSKREVRSVVLASTKKDLKDIGTVALDESSRTSATLLKVIFREFLRVEPVWKPSVPDLRAMLSENDAALIIGDPGMTFPRDGLHVFDMAALWRQYTDLSFVFAMWMVREGASDETKAIDFRAACEEGVNNREKIIDFYERILPLPRSELFAYLHDNIAFELDEEMRRGLELYYRLSEKHGLIPAIKNLNWLSRAAG